MADLITLSEKFLADNGLSKANTLLLPYGSKIYGTDRPDSDWDLIAIVPNNHSIGTGCEYQNDKLNVHVYDRAHFQSQLNDHKIQTLECWFLDGDQNSLHKHFTFTLDKVKLRHELSEKSSNSFVKAKKKIEKEKDYYIGWKSLFHSLRILNFGIQIASTGRINDYGAANHYWFEILESGWYDWAPFKEKYQPVYNQLATEFRKVAPKE